MCTWLNEKCVESDLDQPLLDHVVEGGHNAVHRDGGVAHALGRKFMSCSHVKSWVNLLTRLLIGCSLLGSQSGGASLLVDPTLDNRYNS